MKTEEQIQKEIEALKAVRSNVRPTSTFGDDNLSSVDAQIDVLENVMDNDEIYDKYDRVSSSEYILEAALAAQQWINDEEDLDCEGLACEWPLEEQVMSVKGDWPRPHSTTKEERDLRHKYATTKMTFNQFEQAYRKLMKQGLIKRSGKTIQ